MTQPMPYAIPTMYCPKCITEPLARATERGSSAQVFFCCRCGYSVTVPLERFRFPVEPEKFSDQCFTRCEQTSCVQLCPYLAEKRKKGKP